MGTEVTTAGMEAAVTEPIIPATSTIRAMETARTDMVLEAPMNFRQTAATDTEMVPIMIDLACHTFVNHCTTTDTNAVDTVSMDLSIAAGETRCK